MRQPTAAAGSPPPSCPSAVRRTAGGSIRSVHGLLRQQGSFSRKCVKNDSSRRRSSHPGTHHGRKVFRRDCCDSSCLCLLVYPRALAWRPTRAFEMSSLAFSLSCIWAHVFGAGDAPVSSVPAGVEVRVEPVLDARHVHLGADDRRRRVWTGARGGGGSGGLHYA